MNSQIPAKIYVISDTHAILRPELLSHIEDAELIIHAGDIGPLTIVKELEKIAPVIAARGNCDSGAVAKEYPLKNYFSQQGYRILLTHDIYRVDLNTESQKVDLLIHGHTHRFDWQNHGRMKILNPGSCSPDRYGTLPTLARLKLGATIEIEMIDLSQIID